MQEVTAFIADNRGLLHAVYLMYAELSDDGPLIDLSQFRSFCTVSRGVVVAAICARVSVCSVILVLPSRGTTPKGYITKRVQHQ